MAHRRSHPEIAATWSVHSGASNQYGCRDLLAVQRRFGSKKHLLAECQSEFLVAVGMEWFFGSRGTCLSENLKVMIEGRRLMENGVVEDDLVRLFALWFFGGAAWG